MYNKLWIARKESRIFIFVKKEYCQVDKKREDTTQGGCKLKNVKAKF